jgi:hypothetical protein
MGKISTKIGILIDGYLFSELLFLRLGLFNRLIKGTSKNPLVII